MESIVIKRVDGRERAYPPPNTHIRIRIAHMGNAEVRYVTDDGWLGVHLETEGTARVDETRPDMVTAVSPGGRPLLAQLFAAVAPGPAARQPIPVIVLEVAA